MLLPRASLAWSVALLAAIAPNFLAKPAKIAKQRDVFSWTDVHYRDALDAVLPLEGDGGIAIGYRIVHPVENDFREFSFVLWRRPRVGRPGLEETISAKVRVPDGTSVYQQLVRLHDADRSQDLDAVEKKVKIKEWTFTESDCPAVQSQYKKYEELRFKVPGLYPNRMFTDPVAHEFHLRGFSDDWQFRISDDEHPLVIWGTQTRRALESCISAKESHSGRQ